MSTDQTRRAYGLAWLATLAATLLPFLCVRFPPLLDYPNHLARAYVLAHLDDVPVFGRAYREAWSLMPNLGMDAFFAPLMPVFDLATVSALFFVFLVGLTQLGAHLLGRELHGRATWMAPLAAFFVFSYALFLGFVNYLLAVALFYCAFATWLAFRRTGRTSLLVAAALLGLVTYIAHLGGFGFFAIAVVVWSLAHWRTTPRRQSWLGLLAIVTPTLLHLAVATPLERGGMLFILPWDKLAVARRTFLTGQLGFDLVCLAVFFGALAAMIWWTRPRPTARRLAVGVALLVCYFVAPVEWHGTWALDQRFILPGVALVLLACDIDTTQRRVRWALGAALLALFVRTGVIAVDWSERAAHVDGYVQLMDQIPRGAHVYPISFHNESTSRDWNYDRMFAHLPNYIAFERDAAVPWLFAAPGQQPLRRIEPRVPVRVPPRLATAPEAVDWAGVFATYDTLWTFHPPSSYRSYLGARCRSVHAWDAAVVYGDCRADSAIE